MKSPFDYGAEKTSETIEVKITSKEKIQEKSVILCAKSI